MVNPPSGDLGLLADQSLNNNMSRGGGDFCLHCTMHVQLSHVVDQLKSLNINVVNISFSLELVVSDHTTMCPWIYNEVKDWKRAYRIVSGL